LECASFVFVNYNTKYANCSQRLLHFELLTSFLVTYYGLSIYILNYPVVSTAVSPPTPAGDYGIGLEQLVSMSKDQNISAFQQYGGASLKNMFGCF